MTKTRLNPRLLYLGACALGALLGQAAPCAQNLMPHLEEAFERQQWNEVAQTATEILRQNPGNSQARLRGAFALIHRGYSNAAFTLLKRMQPSEWKALPADMKKMTEVVALFQKKIPFISLPARVEMLNEADASPDLVDEIRFAKGRAAFEKGAYAQAAAPLEQVSKGSRFYGPANYLLGTIAVKALDYSKAASCFSKTFDPQVLQQSTEFWQDIDATTNSQYGTSLNVQLDSNVLKRTSEMGELSLIAMARILYAQKDYLTAVAQYSKIASSSSLSSRARLETVWAMLQMDKHAEAEQAALALSNNEAHFEWLEARPVRALILTDSGKPVEGRQEILRFMEAYTQSKTALLRYRQFPNPQNLPPYIQGDLKEDRRIELITQYQQRLRAEIDGLRKEDRNLFPCFYTMAAELEPLVTQSREYANRLSIEYVDRRLADLERLFVQGKLIIAETYLEEREQLRAAFRGKGVDEAAQDSHDRQLVALLLKAIKEVDDARASMKSRNLSLEFRQSELLWELSSASAFLEKDAEGTTGKEAYEGYRRRAITIVRDLLNFPKFDKRPQAMFFLGFALMEMGDEKEGLSFLTRYTKEFPNHENTPNAFRILADVEFEASRLPKAESLYKEILKFPNSPIVGYALYKIGWCNYGMKNTAKAMLGLEQAILWTRTLENTDHLLSLKREAGRDLISMYAEVGNHKRAYEYFERFLGGGDATKWLADLAGEYERNGLFEKSNDLYNQLLSFNPTGETRLAYQTSIISGAYQLRDWNTVLERTRELVAGYEVTLQPEQPADTPAFKAEKILNEIVMAQHFEFDEYAGKDDAIRLVAIDELYLKAFSQWKTSQMPLYQYAHFLMKHKRVPDAMVAFIKHWEQFRTTLKEPLREESLRNVVHALETVDQEKTGDAAETVARVDNLDKYTDEYGKEYPTNKHARAISFLRTAALLKHERNEAGLEESQKVFDQSFTDDFGARAFKNLRVVYYKLKDWKRTFEWASAMLQKPGIEKTPYVADLKTVREEALFLWADGTQDPMQAAELYLKIAEDSQMQRLRPKALYNAFVRYKELDKRTLALAVATRMDQSTPGAPELQNIAGVRAAYYQEAGDYEKALPLFAQFLKNPPKDTPPEAITQVQMSTALIAENLGQTPAAVALYKAALAASAKDTPVATEAARGLERIEENAKRQPASVKPPFKKWETLAAMQADFEKRPLAKAEGLAARIQGGAARLEKAIRAFLEVSGDPTTPPFHAFESYCSVPFLYSAYQAGIRALGEGQPDELKVELEKLAGPLDGKSSEMADQCLSRAMDGFHDGPVFRKVLKKWGWQKGPALTAQMAKIQGLLGGNAPWMDAAPGTQNEADILKMHLEGQGTPDTWFTLARTRLDAGKMGLARLTLLASLAKEPNAGRILNTLAVMRQMERADVPTMDALLTKAGEAGSGLAYAGLALIHLNGARLDRALAALDKAESAGAFKDKADIRDALSEIDSAKRNDAAQLEEKK